MATQTPLKYNCSDATLQAFFEGSLSTSQHLKLLKQFEADEALWERVVAYIDDEHNADKLLSPSEESCKAVLNSLKPQKAKSKTAEALWAVSRTLNGFLL